MSTPESTHHGQPFARVDFIPQSGTSDLASGSPASSQKEASEKREQTIQKLKSAYTCRKLQLIKSMSVISNGRNCIKTKVTDRGKFVLILLLIISVSCDEKQVFGYTAVFILWEVPFNWKRLQIKEILEFSGLRMILVSYATDIMQCGPHEAMAWKSLFRAQSLWCLCAYIVDILHNWGSTYKKCLKWVRKQKSSSRVCC